MPFSTLDCNQSSGKNPARLWTAHITIATPGDGLNEAPQMQDGDFFQLLRGSNSSMRLTNWEFSVFNSPGAPSLDLYVVNFDYTVPFTGPVPLGAAPAFAGGVIQGPINDIFASLAYIGSTPAIVNAGVDYPDCYINRDVVAFPTIPVTLQVGDSIVARVRNDNLKDGTSLSFFASIENRVAV